RRAPWRHPTACHAPEKCTAPFHYRRSAPCPRRSDVLIGGGSARGFLQRNPNTRSAVRGYRAEWSRYGGFRQASALFAGAPFVGPSGFGVANALNIRMIGGVEFL